MRFAVRLSCLLVAILVASVGCGRQGAILSAAEERGTLRVGTLNAASTYYVGGMGPAGFEHDLVSAFARDLDLTAEFVVYASVAEALMALDGDAVDLVAAGLTITPARKRARAFSPPYHTVEEVVVCGRGVAPPDTVEALASARLSVAAGSAHVESLARLESPLQVEVVEGASWDAVLSDVSSGARACTILDDRDWALERRYRSNLRAGLTLPGTQALGWALGGEGGARGRDLERATRAWFRKQETRRLIERLNETYFGFAPEDIAVAHSAEFRRAIDQTLPTYRALFEETAAQYDMPWTLLAAVAYQESHWDPKAKSPTGVRGMMMLTLPTAKDLGVTNRLDPVQSTRGGARYLRQLYDRLPDDIAPEDRWWFAAASYNLGLGHVRDAKALTRRRGGNGYRWADVREALALLEDADTNADLTFGYARGREAALYVRRIRDYYDVLQQRFAPEVEGPPPVSGDLAGE